MVQFSLSKVVMLGIAMLGIAVSLSLSRAALAAQQPACKFLASAAVSAAIGKPVFGGTMRGLMRNALSAAG